MILAERMAALDPRRVAVRSAAGGVVRFGDLAGLGAAPGGPQDASPGARAPGTGLRVLIHLRDVADAIGVLVRLDGRASAIALTSAWAAPGVLEALAAAAPFDALIRDGSGGDAPVGAQATGLPPAVGPADLGRLPVAAVPARPTAWLMTTSGTTGLPKMVQHSLAGLARSARTDTLRGADQRWGLIYDHSRFAGLQVVLQSLLSGATLIAPPHEAAIEDKIGFLAEQGCTHLSATPTLWRKILMAPQSRDLALRQITLGGEIADAAILGSLARAFPDARIAHIYASTEAGVGFSVSDRRPGFPARYLAEPPAGIAIRVEGGELEVRNRDVAEHYVGGGDLAADGWVRTGDRVAQDGDRVHFLGRASGMINVGGDKVHPEEVEAALLSHPMVRAAHVYGRANPIVGALVAADVVTDPAPGDPAALRAALDAHLASRLARHQRPALIRFVAALALNAAGKIERKTR